MLCIYTTLTAQSGTIDNLTWEIENGTLTISGNGDMPDYNDIPWSSYRNSITAVVIESGVTSIGAWAFSDCKNLNSITIPNGVTSIGDGAFFDCENLIGVNIPNSVTSIRWNTFFNCINLTSITIPNNVTNIESHAFFGCESLVEINIPNSVTSIGYGTFDHTPWLNNQPDGLVYVGKVLLCYKGTMPENASINIAKGTAGVASGAFSDYNNLKEITIPNSVTNIGDGVFSGCDGLIAIHVDESNASYSSLSGVLYDKNKTELIHCPYGATSIVIPGSIRSVESFSHYHNLISVTISEGVDSIGEGAFEDCRSLTSITIPHSVTYIGYEVFYDCINLTEAFIGRGVTTIESILFYGCNKLIAIHVDEANASFSSLDGVLYNKDKTKLIECPSSVTSITIPNSVTSIGEGAFAACGNLTQITIPNGITSIGGWAFDDTPWLNNQPDGLVYAGKMLLCYKGDMPENTSISIAEETIGVADRAFENCINLTSITIPNSVTSIGKDAFEFCKNLTSILIPNSVTSIGKGAFSYCNSLTSITIPNNVTSIERALFWGCSNLVEIIIPSNVTNIGDGAFANCTSLTEITLPSSVTNIGEEVFYYCSNLKSLYSLNTTPPACDANAFERFDASACTLYVPKGSKGKYETAEGWREFTNIVEIQLSHIDNPERNLFDFDIYLNTSDETLCISGINDNTKLTLTDINGRIVLSQIINNNEYIQTNLLPSDIYIIKLWTEKGCVEKKIIKQ